MFGLLAEAAVKKTSVVAPGSDPVSVPPPAVVLQFVFAPLTFQKPLTSPVQ